MNQVYVSTTLKGKFCAFARIDDIVRVYIPDAFRDRHLAIKYDDWLKLAADYHQPNDLASYDNVVNAAWQCMGFSDPLVKRNAQSLKTIVGKYYPRIWRGIYQPSIYYCYNPVRARTVFGSAYIRSNVAAASLYGYLQELFRYIEPDKENFSVFGNRLREILILTCTDVEASWRAVLEGNIRKPKTHYTTGDYIKIKDPLRLAEWEVALRDYPDLGSFRPFETWSVTDTTKSLPWYHAYNAVKHHRDAKFASASLENMINAVAAVHILQSAQWGPEIYDRMFGNLYSPFVTTKHPVFDLADLYVPTLDDKEDLQPERFF